MIVVIDPGVAIKWFVEEPLRPQARSLLVHGHEVVAPDILVAGVAELAWKKTVAGEIAPDQAEPIVRNIGLPAFVSAFVESTRLRNRALCLFLFGELLENFHVLGSPRPTMTLRFSRHGRTSLVDDVS